ncbi:hypothetical protein GH714_037228 [Hevea brasiliensis]|uniref:Xylanase inhibitor C-terminal domain-containing protein n=1 Tax=Hevea brasiliensis TaxID=3981 RepID=A0A6A6KG52_HEVBR|nr:hypothetical protein GH714_037228 [Hevea brasiliensis]
MSASALADEVLNVSIPNNLQQISGGLCQRIGDALRRSKHGWLCNTLEMSEAHYYLNLQGIDIGLNKLDIDEGVFRRNVTDQSKLIGVIIELGTPATWLIDQAYDRFRNEVRRTLARLVVEDMGECVYCFCFKGNMTQELQGFPDVIYHFGDGADLQGV